MLPGAFVGYNPIVLIADQWAVETHEDVHSVYSKLNWAFRDNQDVTLGVTYEEDDGPDSPYWRVRAGYVIRF